MVSFICNVCGQTVRKAQVERHYQNDCRNCEVLSCIDCGRDFHGDEYTSHTSCITEAEKYQGKLYKPKDRQNKGEHKQQEWLKQVREASRSEKVDPRLSNLLDRISEYSNIPRKKVKFQNFCKNSIGVRDDATLDKLWNLFSESTKNSQEQGVTSSNGVVDHEKSNGSSFQSNAEDQCNGDSTKHTVKEKNHEVDDGNVEQNSKDRRDKKTKKHKERKKFKDIDSFESEQRIKEKKYKSNSHGNAEESDKLVDTENEQKRKRKRNEEEDGKGEPQQSKILKMESEGINGDKNQFNWKSTIKAVLRQAPDQELQIKRLRKKVLAEFEARGANTRNLSDNELRALFEKKITKNPKFKVHKDRVKLVK
nr:cell growth-regulating nucleolar protein-like [Pocillopora verrucosa]